MVDDLLDVLQLDPDATVVVAFPEPVSQTQGEARPEVPAGQEGLRKLEGMLASAGFEVWEEPRTNLPTSRLASSRSARASRGSRMSPASRLGSSRA